MQNQTGRCLCGAVRFRFSGEVLASGHCHCESCRRATSSPVTTFFTVAKQGIAFSGDDYRFYASSPSVRRGFCGRCGSPLSYENEQRPEEMDIYVASLDPGGDFDIKEHWHWAERVSWLHCDDDLPKT